MLYKLNFDLWNRGGEGGEGGCTDGCLPDQPKGDAAAAAAGRETQTISYFCFVTIQLTKSKPRVQLSSVQ